MSLLRPLDGVVVVETDPIVSLAFCGKYLAALGAEVAVRDDGTRFNGSPASLRAYLDDGKRVIGAEAGDVLESVDVVLTSAGSAGARSVPDPRQIIVVSSDFGAAGPRSGWVGSELVAQAAGGLLDLVGTAGGPPVRIGGRQLDFSVGLAALSAVMIALIARTRSGRGQRVDVSRLETTAFIEWKGGTYAQVGSPLQRGESSGPVVVRCTDGLFGLFYRPSDWPAIVEELDSPVLREERFATQAGRVRHLDELRESVTAVTSSISRQDLYTRLQAQGVPAGPVFDMSDLLGSAQYQARQLFVPLPAARPDVVQPGLPFVLNRRRPAANLPSPSQEE